MKDHTDTQLNEMLATNLAQRAGIRAEIRDRRQKQEAADAVQRIVQEAKERKEFSFEEAESTIAGKDLKDLGFHLYTDKDHMDFMTVPMAYIRLGADCWLHYYRRDGAAFLTNNHVHMKRRMIAYMPWGLQDQGGIEDIGKPSIHPTLMQRVMLEAMVVSMTRTVLDQMERSGHVIVPTKEIEEAQEKLAPCPHCGGLAVAQDNEQVVVFIGGPASTPNYFKVQCYKCNASVEQLTIEQVISVWNKRS